MPTPLTELRVAGFRSLKDVSLTLGPVTVLVGPNGSGKSDLLTVLKLFSLMRTCSLRSFVARAGGASRLLHGGPHVTPSMRLGLQFAAEEAPEAPTYVSYETTLEYASGDALVFFDETAFEGALGQAEGRGIGYNARRPESPLAVHDPAPTYLLHVWSRVDGMGFLHIRDTSTTSPLRQNASQADSKTLREDASNLAAYLYRVKRSESDDARAAWTLLGGLVRRVAPSIKALEPDLVDPDSPETSAVRLYWTDARDHRFDVHDLSDGTLRAIALFAALTQPPATRPTFLAIDEPELGLHPAALALFAALVRSASAHTQILLATQSPALLDAFTPEEIVVTDHERGETVLKRLDPEQLAGWLDAYSLSELYDKNVLGGRP